MELQLSTILFLLFFSSAPLLILPSTTSAHPIFPPSPPPPPPPTSNQTDNYIRTTCQTTRYPETCFTTLSKYSNSIKHDPSRLATVAIHVALSNATRMSTYVTNMVSRHQEPDNTTESAAIRDCSSVFADALYEIRKSMNEMKRLGWTGESVRFQLSNVQTWMSAALTNEDTCIDGFEEMADGEMKEEVCGRVKVVMEVTSNALALVNSYADTIRPY